MKQFILIATLFIIGLFGFAQPNVVDSLKLCLNTEYNDSVKIDKLNQFILLYAPNHPEKVLMYADTAIGLSSKIQDSARLAFSINRKGVALYYMGDYNSSLECYFLALNIKEKTGQVSDIYREYNNIGLVLRNLDQNEEALKYFKMALENESSKSKEFEAITWNNIGISHRGLKQYAAAKESLDKALAINTEINAKQAIAHNFNNLGNVLYDQKEYEDAINYFKKALEINVELFNNYEQTQNLNNLAKIYLAINNYPQAQLYLEQAEHILTEMRADQIELINLSFYAKYYVGISNFKQANDYLLKYVKLSDSINSVDRIRQFDQLKNLANAEKEIQEVEFLKKINSIQDEKIRFQNIIQWVAGLVILIILSLLFMVLNNLKIKKKMNRSLKEQSEKLESLNEELTSAMDKLKETQQQLVQSEKMASLGVLSAGIAHEINNPLNFIHGGIYMLEDYISEKLKDHKVELIPMIQGIQLGVSRASNIITSLNHYSIQDNVPQTECNIHSIIDNCLGMLQSQLKNKVIVKKQYINTTSTVIGSEGKLQQAFLNIISNAEEAISDIGTIEIETKAFEKTLVITITDSGEGISTENLQKIVDPFFTTKDPGKGTGLGLSITYNIIKEHGGTIDFESQLGNGTKVIITLPIIVKKE